MAWTFGRADDGPHEAEDSFAEQRERMVRTQLESRGIRDPRVLAAFRRVPREEFVPVHLKEFAYRDSPLPIEERQTISQPFIVALTCEALELAPDDRVLEIGTGSGYAAAVLAQVASEVYTVERHGPLAQTAHGRLERLGYDNVYVLHGDGTQGWEEHAPYDAIAVAAGGPRPPRPLLEQLAPGGRLVIPVGETPRLQKLVRIRRTPDGFTEEDLGDVAFVPLIGAEGWGDDSAHGPAAQPAEPAAPAASEEPTWARLSAPELIGACAEPFETVDDADLAPLLERIGDARVVCLGEATHGTAEFYDFRARLTLKLVETKGFSIVAAEADWPDAAHLDHFARHLPGELPPGRPFTRFPTWMWRNHEVLRFVRELRERNARVEDFEQRAGFYGLDLYSLYSSIRAVLEYLESVDPQSARVARERYGCLTPWEGDPATYGRAAVSGRYRECEQEVIANLKDLLRKRLQYASQDGHRFFDAVQNARLVANAESYYRVMYYGSRESWNLRDRHMFGTLQALLEARGPGSKAVVWAHNSHLGDASATEMGSRGEINVGYLCREHFGKQAYLLGFGTDHGTVAAASHWDGPMEIKDVRPSHSRSYERLAHDTGLPAFLLPLRSPRHPKLREELSTERLERAIGVIYRPESELASHYFRANLPRQFDEWVWFDESSAVDALRPESVLAEGEVPETFPFGV